jgi:hypothetical protein
MQVSTLDGLLRLIWMADVERHRKYSIAKPFLEIGNTVQLSGGGRNVISAFKCRFGPNAAHAAGASSYKPSFHFI